MLRRLGNAESNHLSAYRLTWMNVPGTGKKVKHSNKAGRVMMLLGIPLALASLITAVKPDGPGFRALSIWVTIIGGIALALAGAFSQIVGKALQLLVGVWVIVCLMAAIGAQSGLSFLCAPLHFFWPGMRGAGIAFILIVLVFFSLLMLSTRSSRASRCTEPSSG